MTDDLDYTETIIHECAGCERTCFDVQACPICREEKNDRSLLCSGCRKACARCDESVCYDHWNDKAKICTVCDTGDRIASGEALADWKWGRDE